MSETVLHVVGARPNFPKAAPVIHALEVLGVPQRLVHTGQHYDGRLSGDFLRQLGLPEPDLNLGVGSASHARQTAAVMTGLEDLILASQPGIVLVYGDVNSTLAAALVAAKLRVPLAHVEAGLRSFDLSMPEEINRMVTDRLSNLLFATSADAVAHLAREGADPATIHLVGNPMIDTLLANLHLFDAARARSAYRLAGRYVVATVHRPSNVDDPVSAAGLVKVLHLVAEQVQLVLPLHPRGRPALEAAGLGEHPGVRVLDPLGYVEFLSLVRGADAVITDSGGVQEETTMLGIPCLTLRPNTERPVTITHGTNRLVTPERLPSAVGECLSTAGSTNLSPTPATAPATARVEPRTIPPLWDGRAGQRIAQVVAAYPRG